MMFWVSHSGKPITGNDSDSFLDDFSPIPDGTLARASIKKFELIEEAGVPQLYQITWRLVDGDFSGREVRQKIKTFDSKDEVADKALNMLKRVYMLCGHEPTHEGIPTNNDLQPMLNRICGIRIKEWSLNVNGEIKEGNWVNEIHQANTEFVSATGIKKDAVSSELPFPSALSRNKAKGGAVDPLLDDDIPF